jgi:hypothetical protein
MITENKRHVLYSNNAKKESSNKIKAETVKHAGKEVSRLSAKERDDLLLVLCEGLNLVNENGILLG